MAMMKVFRNGKIVTMNPAMPEASAFAVFKGRFLAVGSGDAINRWVEDGTEVVDLKGKTVAPGFIETHNHLSSYAMTLMEADCRPETNKRIEDVKTHLREKVEKAKPGEWIKGWGYDDTLIAEKRHLTRADLDGVSSQHPIQVLHISGHLAYANSKALEIAGIGPETPQPAGGKIHKDGHDRPTGLLLEPGAIKLVGSHIPIPSLSDIRRVFPEAVRYCHQFGITSIHDSAIGYQGEAREVCQVYREMDEGGELNLRVYLTIMYDHYDKLIELGLGRGFGSDSLKLGCVKLFQDGSIQGLTAALGEDYHNQPGFKGDLIMPQEALDRLIDKYHRAGLQMAVHANGDRAIESVLQSMEKAQKSYPRSDFRHMIIHCQMASDDHIRRMKGLGVIPNYFVNHVYYWGDRHLSTFLGPRRARRIDPLGSSMKVGLEFVLHSDLPVTPLDPIFSMHNAVNRITRQGEVLGPEERVPVLEALKAYTVTAAKCSFEEHLKGSIEQGKLADFIVLSDNPLTCASEKIKDIRVKATVMGGREVYGRIQ
jgi:predicted amidohydrolase YtcJ